ncbi:MAG: thiolase family protein [Ilumatobacteraceae bacterium]
MSEPVWILGIHMTKFGKHLDRDATDLAVEATLGALDDAGMTMADLGIIVSGQLQATDGSGQRIQKQLGQTGIPVLNVANVCATGATALRTAMMSIQAGDVSCALAVGVEKLYGAGLLGAQPVPEHARYVAEGRDGAVVPRDGMLGTESMPGVIGQIGVEYGHRYGDVSFETFAKIAEKSHLNSTLNPLAAYTRAMSLTEIMNDKMIAYPNTRSMCSANCDGAAAAVLVGEQTLRQLDEARRERAVKIAASVLTTDPWTAGCQVLPDMNTLTRNVAVQAYERAGVGPEDLDLVELHDCFATAELVHYDNLMLCEEGGAVDFLESGAPFRGGSMPVNVSGGLQSKGHPIAATGIANVWEICQHLRGAAGARQVDGARVGLAHVFGLGSSAAVHILTK